MRHVIPLVLRELASYFFSPMAFLILLAFQVIAWLNFWDLVDALARYNRSLSGLRDPLNTYITGSTPFWIGILVAVPALTMRLLAEERRSGTLEPLLTAPVTEAEVVIAKWLAGVVMYLVLLLPFALYLPFLYYQAKYHFDLGPVVALGVGLTTVGMMFVAIGLFFSSLTRNQIVAAIWTFAVLFLLVLINTALANYATLRRASWGEVIGFVSVINQLTTLGTGRLDLRFLAIHLSTCALMLYLTTKVVQFRREG